MKETADKKQKRNNQLINHIIKIKIEHKTFLNQSSTFHQQPNKQQASIMSSTK